MTKQALQNREYKRVAINHTKKDKRKEGKLSFVFVLTHSLANKKKQKRPNLVERKEYDRCLQFLLSGLKPEC